MDPTWSLLMPLTTCGYEHNLNTSLMQVVDCPHLHVEQIANLSMAIGVVAHAVKLKVNVAQTSFGGFATEVFCSSRIRFRWSLPERCCNQPCARI